VIIALLAQPVAPVLAAIDWQVDRFGGLEIKPGGREGTPLRSTGESEQQRMAEVGDGGQIVFTSLYQDTPNAITPTIGHIYWLYVADYSPFHNYVIGDDSSHTTVLSGTDTLLTCGFKNGDCSDPSNSVQVSILGYEATAEESLSISTDPTSAQAITPFDAVITLVDVTATATMSSTLYTGLLTDAKDENIQIIQNHLYLLEYAKDESVWGNININVLDAEDNSHKFAECSSVSFCRDLFRSDTSTSVVLTTTYGYGVTDQATVRLIDLGPVAPPTYPERTYTSEESCLANNPQGFAFHPTALATGGYGSGGGIFGGGSGSRGTSGGGGGSQSQHPAAPDPVNTRTGNYTRQEVDFSIPTQGLPLTFGRTYNSLDTTAGSLGRGWTHAYNMRLVEEEGLLVLVAPEAPASPSPNVTGSLKPVPGCAPRW
jgi:uncharacterized membrane protein YgcG